MLTAPATFPIDTGGPAQQAEAFEGMCARFFEEISQNASLYPTMDQQSRIYKSIQKFAPSSHIENIVVPTTIVQWLQILSSSHFPTGDMMGNLLKNTAKAVLNIYDSFNLEQSTIILDKLTTLLKSQAFDQKLYSCEDPTTSLKDMIPTLGKLIMQIISLKKERNSIFLNPEQVITILKAMGSSAFILTSEEADKVFIVLTQQIEFHTSQQSRFNSAALKEAFWGLRHSHGRDSQALENLLQALLLSLQKVPMDEQGMFATILSSVIYSLRSSTGESPVIKSILEHVTLRLNVQTVAQQWLPAYDISQIIAGLVNMTKNTETETLLQALLPHMTQWIHLKQSTDMPTFSLHNMGMILEGLEHFADSHFALNILNVLTAQLAPPSFVEAQAINREKWLANVIYSLSSYLDKTASSTAKTQAMVFLETAIDRLELRSKLKKENFEFTAEDISEQKKRESLIIDIGNFTDTYWALSVNLSGYACSRALVHFIARFIRQMELNDEIDISTEPRPICFSEQKEGGSTNFWYDVEEMEWMIKNIFEKIFPQNVPHEHNGLSRSSGTSSTSHTSHTEEESDGEDVVSAAAAP